MNLDLSEARLGAWQGTGSPGWTGALHRLVEVRSAEDSAWARLYDGVPTAACTPWFADEVAASQRAVAQHPAFVGVRATGLAEVDGQRVPWVVSAEAPGRPLGEWLAKRGPLDAAAAANLVAPLAAAIHASREAGPALGPGPASLLVDDAADGPVLRVQAYGHLEPLLRHIPALKHSERVRRA